MPHVDVGPPPSYNGVHAPARVRGSQTRAVVLVHAALRVSCAHERGSFDVTCGNGSAGRAWRGCQGRALTALCSRDSPAGAEHTPHVAHMWPLHDVLVVVARAGWAQLGGILLVCCTRLSFPMRALEPACACTHTHAPSLARPTGGRHRRAPVGQVAAAGVSGARSQKFYPRPSRAQPLHSPHASPPNMGLLRGRCRRRTDAAEAQPPA